MNIPDNNPNCEETGGVDPEKFRMMVEERAYFKAERRGFASGYELADWLEAEQEIRNQCRYWLSDSDFS